MREWTLTYQALTLVHRVIDAYLLQVTTFDRCVDIFTSKEIFSINKREMPTILLAQNQRGQKMLIICIVCCNMAPIHDLNEDYFGSNQQ